jgi:hypothetical protein
VNLRGIFRASLVGGKALDSAIRGPEEELFQDLRDYALETVVRVPVSTATSASSMAGPGIFVTGVHLPG